MKKGFTLIELLAVIIILGVTIAIVITKVDNNIKNANNFVDEQQVKEIENAAYLYAEEFSNEIEGFNTLKVGKVSINTLVEKGYLKTKDVENISTSNVVMIAEIDNYIKTKYTETERNAIFLNGSDTVSINMGSRYVELGAYVAIPGTGLVKLESSNISSNVNNSTKGEYKVTYSYSGAEEVVRKVQVL